MNNLTKILLGSAALCALAIAPAVATADSTSQVTSQYAGRVVNKTKMPNHGATHVTYSFGIYATAPAATPLGTKWTLFDQRLCPVSHKFTTREDTFYGKVTIHTKNASNGCADVSATYKIVKQPSPGDTDISVLTITGKYENNGTKYKGSLNLDFNIAFD